MKWTKRNGMELNNRTMIFFIQLTSRSPRDRIWEKKEQNQKAKEEKKNFRDSYPWSKEIINKWFRSLLAFLLAFISGNH